ncbi:tetratricopeptide repeat protein [Plasticicumulans lactativorans]|uniref:Tetratricopeptide repeat protein n=1 Tax=Plasticicumulans lactativorans TaxID=1133106 RepID=A0A4R2LKL9_9GAMM|nr:tetratricopeptide repeat protein [Plasticicumulans lactativorans]TCO83823.1 tetratricopeptide repeat protein [Plasticicumulans lactativorans]
MSVSLLAELGKFAGIGGLAIGIFGWLFREAIRLKVFPELSPADGYRLLCLYLWLVFGIALAGIGAWVWTVAPPEVAWAPWGLAVTCVLAAAWTYAHRPPTAKASASDSATQIVVNGDNSPVQIGWKPDEVLALVEAVGRGAGDGAMLARIEALSSELGVTSGAVQGFLQTLGRRDIPLERLNTTLAEIAAHHRAMLDRLAALDPSDPVAGEWVSQARDALVAGRYEEADRLLATAETADLAAARQAEQLAAQARDAAERRYIAAAATRAERGEVALGRIDYLAAAEHFRQAAKLVPAQRTDERADYLQRRAGGLYRQGDEFGDNGALLGAIGGYHELLALWPRERVPLDWAATQNNLGNALSALGERESGTARLEEAVVALRAALGEYTRERVPLDWAMTQNNLGNALQVLGERESGTARLEEALAALRAALGERTRERVPLDWAMTQNNLGAALQVLGERESGTARLEEAVAAYRAALGEYTRERVPLAWAATQNNLGNVLGRLGERESGTARLEEAVAAYRAALEVRTRERVPLDWAMTQNNLGAALQALGERESGTARLEEAVVAYRAALDIFRAAEAGHYIGIVESNIAAAEALLQARRRR